MSITLESPSETSLHSVQQAFERWRSNRPGRRSTPIELRLQAVSLIGQHKRDHICKALGINHKVLKRWALESGREDLVEPQQHQPEVNSRFVELPPETASHAELSSKPVTTLRIELANGTVLSTDQSYTLEQILSAAGTLSGACA